MTASDETAKARAAARQARAADGIAVSDGDGGSVVHARVSQQGYD